MESSAQTTRINVLDFFVKPKKTEFLRLTLIDARLKKTLTKTHKRPFLGFTTQSSNMARVV